MLTCCIPSGLPNPKLIPAFEGLAEANGFYTSKSFLPKVYACSHCSAPVAHVVAALKRASLAHAPASRLCQPCTALLLSLGTCFRACFFFLIALQCWRYWFEATALLLLIDISFSFRLCDQRAPLRCEEGLCDLPTRSVVQGTPRIPHMVQATPTCVPCLKRSSWPRMRSASSFLLRRLRRYESFAA